MNTHYIQRIEDRDSYRYCTPNIYRSTTQNSQRVEATQVTISK